MNEQKMEILLRMTYVDMLEACLTNKEFNDICHEDVLWHRMNDRDFPFSLNKTRKGYDHWYRVFDKFTLCVVTSLIIYRTKKNNIEKVYQDVFNLLIDYINQYHKLNLINKEFGNEDNQLDLEIFTKIFKSLNVPFDESFFYILSVFDGPLAPVEDGPLVPIFDKNNWEFLIKISYDLVIKCLY